MVRQKYHLITGLYFDLICSKNKICCYLHVAVKLLNPNQSNCRTTAQWHFALGIVSFLCLHLPERWSKKSEPFVRVEKKWFYFIGHILQGLFITKNIFGKAKEIKKMRKVGKRKRDNLKVSFKSWRRREDSEPLVSSEITHLT